MCIRDRGRLVEFDSLQANDISLGRPGHGDAMQSHQALHIPGGTGIGPMVLFIDHLFVQFIALAFQRLNLAAQFFAIIRQAQVGQAHESEERCV